MHFYSFFRSLYSSKPPCSRWSWRLFVMWARLWKQVQEHGSIEKTRTGLHLHQCKGNSDGLMSTSFKCEGGAEVPRWQISFLSTILGEGGKRAIAQKSLQKAFFWSTLLQCLQQRSKDAYASLFYSTYGSFSPGRGKWAKCVIFFIFEALLWPNLIR